MNPRREQIKRLVVIYYFFRFIPTVSTGLALRDKHNMHALSLRLSTTYLYSTKKAGNER